MSCRRTSGQSAVELAVGLPILVLLLVFIYQASILGLMQHRAQMLANELAADAARQPALLAVDPSLFIDFGVYRTMKEAEFLRAAEPHQGEREMQIGAWQIRLRSVPLLSPEERRAIARAESGSSPSESAAALLSVAGVAQVVVSVSREIAPLHGVRWIHPAAFLIRASAVGGLVQEP